jgi:hypothetical protein
LKRRLIGYGILSLENPKALIEEVYIGEMPIDLNENEIEYLRDYKPYIYDEKYMHKDRYMCNAGT